MIKHISNVKLASLEVGHLVEQGGEVYRVVGIYTVDDEYEVVAIEYLLNRSLSDNNVYRSHVTKRGAVGQIRWHRPRNQTEGDQT